MFPLVQIVRSRSASNRESARDRHLHVKLLMLTKPVATVTHPRNHKAPHQGALSCLSHSLRNQFTSRHRAMPWQSLDTRPRCQRVVSEISRELCKSSCRKYRARRKVAGELEPRVLQDTAVPAQP